MKHAVIANNVDVLSAESLVRARQRFQRITTQVGRRLFVAPFDWARIAETSPVALNPEAGVEVCGWTIREDAALSGGLCRMEGA